MSYFKREPYRNKKILEFAKGQECTLEFPGCNHNPETTVACHFNDHWAGKGVSQKADDCAVVFGCSHCHDVMDYRVHPFSLTMMNINGSVLTEEQMELHIRRAYYRTIRLLLDNGILK